MTAGFFLCSGGGLKGKCEGSSSVGLDVVRSIPFGEEGLEAAKSHTEDQNGSRVRAVLLVEDLGWNLESPGSSTGLVEIHLSQVLFPRSCVGQVGSSVVS